MQLRLDDEYVVKSDNFCFKLGKYIKKMDKEGNEIEVFSLKEYHTTLSSVLNSYVNNKLKNSKSKDKKSLINDLEQINKQIEKKKIAVEIARYVNSVKNGLFIEKPFYIKNIKTTIHSKISFSYDEKNWQSDYLTKERLEKEINKKENKIFFDCP